MATKVSKKYAVNDIRSKKINDKFLVTTIDGSYVVLSKDEHEKLLEGEFDERFFKKLEESNILITEDNEGKIVNNFRKKKGALRTNRLILDMLSAFQRFVNKLLDLLVA